MINHEELPNITFCLKKFNLVKPIGKRYLNSCQHHPILAPYFPMVPGSGFQAEALAAELQSSAGRAWSRGGSGEGWKDLENVVVCFNCSKTEFSRIIDVYIYILLYTYAWEYLGCS